MTDDSIEAKALALADELTDHQRTCAGRDYICTCGYDDAVNNRLEQHEAFKQEVSDALKMAGAAIRGLLDIAPEENLDSEQAGHAYAALHTIDTALEARGLEIREKGQ
jgi:hypothetical protein